jgi:GntR family transcriptional regulator
LFRTEVRQLADLLRGQIKKGRLRPGQKLRSRHDLADEYGVGVDTVVAALNALRAEGLVRTEKRVGSFVADLAERASVPVGGPAIVTARMPDPAEARRLGIPDAGVPVLVVEESGRTKVLAADRTQLEIPGQ